jgi:uncharacterized membrane protein (DUF2068 family)
MSQIRGEVQISLMQPSTASAEPAQQHHRPKTDPSHKRGLRTVALLEASKGLMGTIAGVLVIALVHKDVWDIVESIFEFLHINPDRHFAQVVLDLADRVTDAQLWMLASGLFAYALLRLIEAYGLWRTRVWAEWLAILSGLVYMPFEVHEILRKPTPLRWGLLLINIAMVVYVASVRYSGLRLQRSRRRQDLTQSSG